MSNYRPYPKYKPSGVEWLGEVPDGWRTVPVFSCFRRVKESGHPDLQLLSVYRDYGVIPKDSRDDNFNKASEDLSSYQRIQPGDLVLNKMKAWQGSIGISVHEGIVSPAYFTYRPTGLGGQFDPGYLHHLVRSLEYIAFYLSRSKGIRVNQWDLDPDEFRTTPLICPPLPEQHQIAAFLDRECGKLDALQAKQERLIELLKEKRQALISHAVTKGLDPTAKLKPSGIEWLGEVPEHWRASKVKWVSLTVKTGGTPSDPSWFTDEPDVPWLTPGDFSDECFKMAARRFVTQHAIATREAPLFPPSSVFVVGIGATLGKVARLDQRQPASSNQQINAIVPSKKIESDYLLYSLLAQTEQMKNCSNASTLGIMNQEKTKGIHLALPPLAEQRAIVAHLDEKCGKIDRLMAKAERGIELLKERRSALISAAVTGKIDVRDT
jgi:type I restriction enzyme S subunit